jgi:hypothetical protein
MQLNLTFHVQSQTIPMIIDLFDNPGVRAWAEHCTKLPHVRKVVRQPLPGYPVLGAEDYANAWQHQQQVQQELSGSTTPIPLPVTSADQVTQHHLNVWHRWFTDESKKIDQALAYEEMAHEYHWLHELNQVVHIWERFLTEWPRNTFAPEYSVELNLWPETSAHGFPTIPSVDLEPFVDCHSFQQADLILDQAIHGKSTMQSFLDNDDPKHWDTTGHHLSHGGCKLVTSTNRSAMYQSNEFKQWLTNNNVDYKTVLGDFPLGQIRNKDQALLDLMASPAFRIDSTNVDFEIIL